MLRAAGSPVGGQGVVLCGERCVRWLGPGAQRGAGVQRPKGLVALMLDRLSWGVSFLECLADELDLFARLAHGEAAQRGRPRGRALPARQRTLGRGRRTLVRANPERGKVRVRVSAADAPFLGPVVTTVGVVELVQSGANACGRPVLSAMQPERVAQRSAEKKVDRVVIAVAVRTLKPRIQPLSDGPQVSPYAEVDANDLPVSDLVAKPLGEIDPDRGAGATDFPRGRVILRGPQRVLV